MDDRSIIDDKAFAPDRTFTATAVVLAVIALIGSVRASADPADEHAADRAAIEKLHAEDVEATLSGDPSALARLWADDAVRLEQGRKADVGKPAIVATDALDRSAHPQARIVEYAPEIRDVTIVDGWAFEWGEFTGVYQDGSNGDKKPFRGKLLRVLHKQSDGSWRFARVMWNTSE